MLDARTGPLSVPLMTAVSCTELHQYSVNSVHDGWSEAWRSAPYSGKSEKVGVLSSDPEEIIMVSPTAIQAEPTGRIQVGLSRDSPVWTPTQGYHTTVVVGPAV